jgi:hypothetical protein
MWKSLLNVFLQYKIERSILPGFELDTQFSLNAISPTVVPFDQCEVQIEEQKLHYLRTKKEGSMKKAGLISLQREEVEIKI